MMRATQLAVAFGLLVAAGGRLEAGTLYSNGFETDIAGWDAFGGSFNATRVPSGTNGVTSATGSFHAESSASGSAGDWGGYFFGGLPVFQEYTTSLDIFLDVNGVWANDTRFDFTSAISTAGGGHLQDFAFNAGFYNDLGSLDDEIGFVISASNNTGRANSYPKNPGRAPFTIDTSGWYTFEHHFYDNAGTLNVDLNILDSSSTLLNSWTLGTVPIAGVGGNLYGWFANNEFSTLAFDNTLLQVQMSTVPEPTTLVTFGLGACLLGLGAGRRRRRESARATIA